MKSHNKIEPIKRLCHYSSNNQHTFMICLHLHDLLDPLTRIFSLCLMSDQKWVADHFPLLHLPFGILSLNISALLKTFIYQKSLPPYSYQ